MRRLSSHYQWKMPSCAQCGAESKQDKSRAPRRGFCDEISEASETGRLSTYGEGSKALPVGLDVLEADADAGGPAQVYALYYDGLAVC